MKFHIISIFPEAFESFQKTSIVGKAYEKGLVDFEVYKLNDFAKDTSGHVDDKAFGMHGQVLTPIPLSRAIEYVFEHTGRKIPTIFFTPNGQKLNQKISEAFAAKQEKEYLIICGHYEGIDQRIIDIYVDHEISLGDFILTGGELPAQVFMDSVIRLLPGVLKNSISHEEESFSDKLFGKKEYPVYTRPQDFMGHKVPEVLLSGNHKHIETWKHDNLR